MLRNVDKMWALEGDKGKVGWGVVERSGKRQGVCGLEPKMFMGCRQILLATT